MNDFVERALDRARQVQSKASELRAEASERVVRWEWTHLGAALDRPEPLFRERFGDSAGPVRRRDKPTAGQSAEGYGYDEHDRIVQSTSTDTRVPGTGHRYLRYQPDGIEIAGYTDDDVSIAEFALITAGRVTAFARLPNGGGTWWEQYEYNTEGQLVKARGRIDYPSPDPHLEVEPFDTETQVKYDDAGRLAEIVYETSLGSREVVFRAKPPSKRDVTSQLQRLLVEGIAELAVANAPKEEVYALLLHYDAEFPIPPIPVFATAHHRDRVLTAGSPTLYGLWNPAEIPGYDGIGLGGMSLSARDPRIRVVAADLAHLDKDGSLGRKVLQRVCRDLNQLEWSHRAHVTDDFVVTCVDLETEHVEADLRAGVADRTLRQRLVRQGFLSRT